MSNQITDQRNNHRIRAQVPQKPIQLMKAVYKQTLPAIHKQLSYWKRKAENISDQELREQALSSIKSKQFHCQGGGVYALLAPKELRTYVYQFIVAYQTISDYLDNLCDRSISQDATNFRRLHQAMIDALTKPSDMDELDYYEYQEHKADNGYLKELVQTCQAALERLPSVQHYHSHMMVLAQLYCDLQVYKHITPEKREEALRDWWENYKDVYSQLEWYEFAAATGSTLGLFYYAALAANRLHSDDLDQQAFQSYFPYVQGLHILLDYFIDQEEDRQGGDLNFCFYYKDEREKQQRLLWMYQQSKHAVDRLPFSSFHQMVVDGLISIYLADPKVRKQQEVRKVAKSFIKQGSWIMRFFHWNGWLIHRKIKKV
ncbi:tetraprenyl-beta-curcumene synthase family protein [Bacillus horti]|uniref:Tetraprenyl-beta-curcumene synthase n=1 Tax=Caldalkalibacillus horti TaxID=77523 RepID=A0ABT9VWQ6_9BACI|nr:tetraprenyl-beta-curcumene synthase family protein [Bacillus horti]MDQ0165404.1 tetraprenyl-beta-curcumene synthase [Bacillus horti]